MKKTRQFFLFLIVLAVTIPAAYGMGRHVTMTRALSSISSSARSSIGQLSSQAREVSGGAADEDSAQCYFPRDKQAPAPVLTGIISSANSGVDMAIYSFTDRSIANALIQAKQRGVEVRVITDREASRNTAQKAILDLLKKSDIPVRINTHAGLMHLKVTIIDQRIATTGSFNYTRAAEQENDEVFVVLTQPQTARQFDGEFTRMWNDTQNYTAY